MLVKFAHFQEPITEFFTIKLSIILMVLFDSYSQAIDTLLGAIIINHHLLMSCSFNGHPVSPDTTPDRQMSHFHMTSVDVLTREHI